MRRFAEARFDDVRLPVSAVVGGVGGADELVERLLQIASVLQCAESCGAIDRVFEMTIEYLGDRYSFGRPLSSYQALKHRVADEKVWLEACHAIATAAARAVAAGTPDAGRAGERGQGVDRPARHRAGAGLRPAPRRHRRHLGARPAPLPATHHREPRHLRHARGAHRPRRHPGAGDGRRDRWSSSRSRTSAPAPACGSPTTCRRSRACPTGNYQEAGRRDHERELQRRLWDGGFAGICFPADYGGLGLTIEHQRAFTEESLPYDMPFSLNVPTLGILAATLVDFGTHEQKLRHLPAILKGEELWVQFLSEPSGGSDLAGVLTRAERDGDVYILNGSKIWSSGAAESDYAMCLARTNWDVPKHRGLTMFIMKIHQPGIQVEQIRQVDGSLEFCQEFFDDVPIPAADVIGEVDDGWTVATRLLVHERNAVGGGSPYLSGRAGSHEAGGGDDRLVELVKTSGRAGDAHVRQLVAEAAVHQLVGQQLVLRVTEGVATGKMAPAASSVLKLFSATSQMRRVEIGLEVAGSDAVAWPDGSDGPAPGHRRVQPVASGALAGRWQQRDPAQHHQRAPARDAPRARGRPRRAVPRREARRLPRVTVETDLFHAETPPGQP